MSVVMLQAGRGQPRDIRTDSSTLQHTHVEETKVPKQLLVVALCLCLEIPLPRNRLAPRHEGDEGKQRVHDDEADERPQRPAELGPLAEPQQGQRDGDLEEAKCKRCLQHGLVELRLEQYHPLARAYRVHVSPVAVVV